SQDTPEIIVTASRIEQPLKDVVADVTRIDRVTIERSGASAIADLLSRTPGIQFARNGGPGTTTSVYLRGADTRFTAVYVDGVRIDSQSTGGAAWEAIPLSQIDHIEILRGPAAAIYGSDALAGVIQVFTRKGKGAFTPFVGVGLGTYKTKKTEAGFSGKEGEFDYSVGLSQESSNGFNAKQGANPDSDGYSNYAANIRMGLKVNADHRLDATVLNSGVNAQYDSSLTADDHARNQLQTTGLAWRAKWSDVFSTKAMVTQGKSHYDTYPSAYSTDTNVKSYLWQNEFRFANQFVTAALERREDALQNASVTPAATRRSQNALAFGYGITKALHTLQLNARRDVDSEFGSKTTGSAAYAYDIAPAWRTTASLGTAFRAPTLYQRFSQYGSASLQPESSINRELGVKYANQGDSFGVVTFKNKIDNLIVYVTGATGCASAFGCYKGTQHADLQGITMTGATTVRTVKLAASMDWLRPLDTDTGKNLARRAQRVAMLSADMPVASWHVGSELQLVGARFEDAANTIMLGGYGLVNLYGTRKINKDTSFLLRLNNASNHWYQTANTYNTPGRSVFVGVRWEPQ
ncbi:MAG: hypothetical protein RLY95_777, partial [Pseudomonadota bacterium]